MRNLRYGLQEKSAHRFNTLADILSKIARKVSKNRKFKLNQQALNKQVQARIDPFLRLLMGHKHGAFRIMLSPVLIIHML